MNWQLEHFETTLNRRVSVVLTLWFTVVMGFLFFFHLTDTIRAFPDSGGDLLLKGLALAFDLVASGLFLVRNDRAPWYLPLGRATMLVNFGVTFVTLVLHHRSRFLAAAIFAASPAFVIILGLFANRLLYGMLMAISLAALYLAVFVIFPGFLYRPEFDYLTSDPERYSRLILLIQGAVLVFLLGVVLLDQSIKNSVFRRLRSSWEVLRNQAHFDQETGLPNGRALEQTLHLQGSRVDPAREVLLVAGFRLDGLAELKLRQGYDAANAWLVGLARQVHEAVNLWKSGLAGGDQSDAPALFVVEPGTFVFWAKFLREGLNQTTASPEVFQKMLLSVLRGSPEAADLGFVGAFSLAPDDAARPEQLQANVVNMLHQPAPSDRFQFLPFHAATYEGFLRRQSLKQHLSSASFSDEVTVLFQPKVTSDGRRCTGFEALARWKNPILGQVSPAEFIPLAERAVAIETVTEMVIDQALQLIDRLKQMTAQPFRVSFNLSPVMLNRSFLLSLEQKVARRQAGSWLEIEITEGVLMKAAESVGEVFATLMQRGVQFSIDDFGTGYSNLAYLQRFEASILKIDKSFVDGLPHSEKSANLVHAIVGMARSFGMECVAEGVETAEQVEFLFRAGCQQIQGFYYAQPLSLAAAVTFFTSGSFATPRS